MRDSTRNQIQVALVRGPRTQTQIIGATGLSRATVIHALQALDLAVVPGSWPRQYALPDDLHVPEGMPDQRKAPEDTGTIVTLTQSEKGWVNSWPTVVPPVVELLVATKLGSRTKREARKIYIDNLRDIARITASLAHALDTTIDAPDWYTLLGGTIEG